jgi:hypothetical protein
MAKTIEEIKEARTKLNDKLDKLKKAESVILSAERQAASKVLEKKKYLLGAWALKHMPEIEQKAKMDGFLTRTAERALFGLEAKP